MAAHTALAAVQARVFAALSGDSGLTNIAPVFDHVPVDQAGVITTFPWVLIADLDELPDDTLGEVGRSLIVGIDAWSQYEGFKEIEGIVEEVVRILDKDTLADPTGWDLDHCIYTHGKIDREADGLTRHARMDFTIGVHL